MLSVGSATQNRPFSRHFLTQPPQNNTLSHTRPQALAEAYILTGKLVQVTDKSDLKDPDSEDIVWLRGTEQDSLAGTYLATKAMGNYGSDSDGSGMAIEQNMKSQAVMLRQTRDESSSYTFKKRGKAFRYTENVTDEERAFHASVMEKVKAALAAKRAAMAPKVEQFYGPDGLALFALANAMNDDFGIPFWEDWNSRVPSKAWYSSRSVEGAPANFNDFGLMFCPSVDGKAEVKSEEGGRDLEKELFNPADPAFVRVHKIDLERLFREHSRLVTAPPRVAFPPAILNFTSLRVLWVDGGTANNALKNMPEGIPKEIGGRLPQLKKLGLKNIHLGETKIPMSLSACPLEEIDLNGTKLGSWTPGLFARLSKTLRAITLPQLDASAALVCLKDLETCAMLEILSATNTKLPALLPMECFANKPRLREILFNGNANASLPDDLPVLPALETIKLRLASGCRIKNVAGLASCKVLTNWGGKMAEIPTGIERLVNLVEFDISGITEPWAIGDWIGGLRHLRKLKASNASITQISEAIGECISLTRVELHHNEKLTALPASFAMLHHLRALNLGSCKELAVWPVSAVLSFFVVFTADAIICVEIPTFSPAWRCPTSPHIYSPRSPTFKHAMHTHKCQLYLYQTPLPVRVP